jgi:hypothetical protein
MVIFVCCENIAEAKAFIKDHKNDNVEYMDARRSRGRHGDGYVVHENFKNNRDFFSIFKDVYYSLPQDKRNEFYKECCETFFNQKQQNRRHTDAKRYYEMVDWVGSYLKRQAEKKEV